MLLLLTRSVLPRANLMLGSSSLWGAQTQSCWRPAVFYRVTECYRGQSEAGERLGWLRPRARAPEESREVSGRH
jgi:hypothetical protein